MLLSPGTTCWRREKAWRAAVLVDMEAYFDAAADAMSRARHSIHFLNWAFEATTHLHPQPGGGGPDSDRIGQFLIELSRRPGLDVRVLCWKSAMPVAATQHFFPWVDRRIFAGTNVRFELDGRLPLGACHHQKMIVIDDAIAFCGGGDIGPDRWDTAEHLDDDPRREKTRRDNACFDSRHEVMAVVDGPAAVALGDLFRLRWRRATGEALAPCPPVQPVPWPTRVTPGFRHVDVGVSRTVAAWRAQPEVKQVEALHVASIRAARSCIYMESQYFTSPLVAAELARRLEEPDGPEVVLISTERSPSYFDQMTMDKTRAGFIRTLKAADRHGRFHIYCPVTRLGNPIIVHSKLAIIDDTLLRVGSANINNRSMGFDTECDLSLEAAGEGPSATRTAILQTRNQLLAHWLGCPTPALAAAIAQAGSVGGALEAMRQAGADRLRPIEPQPLGPLAALIAKYHLGDAVGPADSWRPWKRLEAIAAAQRQPLPAPATPILPPAGDAARGCPPPREAERATALRR